MPSDPRALLRSRSYLQLLVIAAVLGVPVSAAAYGFLALVNGHQQEIFTHLPHALGFSAEPVWWPLPVLAVGGVLTGLAIQYLPGNGGASPADGFLGDAGYAPAVLRWHCGDAAGNRRGRGGLRRGGKACAASSIGDPVWRARPNRRRPAGPGSGSRFADHSTRVIGQDHSVFASGR
jgi:hypothetical protein